MTLFEPVCTLVKLLSSSNGLLGDVLSCDSLLLGSASLGAGALLAPLGEWAWLLDATLMPPTITKGVCLFWNFHKQKQRLK